MIKKFSKEEVIEMLNSYPEQSKFDWKKEINISNGYKKSEIAKDVIAIANAHGNTDGFIIYGVNPEREDPIIGISTTIDDATIQQIVNSKVKKPIDFLYFEEELEGKKIGIIKVTKNQKRPFIVKEDYGILKKGTIPIRKGSSTDFASDEDLEKMYYDPKRTDYIHIRATALLKRLLRRAEERFENQPTRKNFKAFQCVSVIPVFPHTPVVALEDLSDIANNSEVHNRDFPPSGPYKIAHESIVYETQYNAFLNYTEINQFGLIFSKQSLWQNDNGKDVYLFETSKLVNGVLKYALNFYEKVGYTGLILISLSLEGIKGGVLTTSTRAPYSERPSGSPNIDDFISVERKITVNELSERFDEIVKDLFNEFLWSFGVDNDSHRKELIDKMYKK